MALFKITKKNNCHTFKIRNSRALGGTSRVVLELKPFGISIRGLIGSEPWVGRSTGKMSRNSSVYGFVWIPAIIYKVVCTLGQILGPRALCQVLAFHLYSFDLNCGATSHLPITWATTKLVTIMSS